MPEQKIEATPDEKDLQNRVQLFDQDFQAIQRKYMLRVVAQMSFPGGALLTVPIQVFPISTPKAPPADEATVPA